MAQYVSHYLVNWDWFCDAWAEEEHPLDALEDAEVRGTRDDTFSSTFWFPTRMPRWRAAARRGAVSSCSHRSRVGRMNPEEARAATLSGGMRLRKTSSTGSAFSNGRPAWAASSPPRVFPFRLAPASLILQPVGCPAPALLEAEPI